MVVLASWSGGALPTPTNGSLTVDALVGIPDTPSLKIAGGAVVANSWIPTFTMTPTVSLRLYLRTPPAWPSGAFSVAALRNGGSNSLYILNIAGTGAPGQIRMVKSDGATVVSSPNGTIQNSTDYRFELLYNSTETKATLSVYELGSNIPLWTAERVDAMFNLPIDRVAVGKTNNSPTIAGDWWFDSVQATDSYASVGPVEDIAEPTYTVQYWNGVSLLPATLPAGYTIKSWTGSELV